jgi:flagellar basal-body rod modification protein FlgD
MDVSKAQNGLGLQTTNDVQARESAVSNAVNSFQAKYGEKPKEARVIKKALDKDDFMRIMVTEMKHQDPTKPMDSDRMATQMAQITSVEQLKNVGSAIEKLADKNTASDRLAMSAMIGKSVTVDKGRFAHQKGTLSPVNFELPSDAQKIKLSILNERGDEVATRELEPMKAGANSYNWDGINASSIQSATGSYIVRIDAEDKAGNKIKIDPISQETVVGITFEGGETNFLVGDPKNPQKVGFKNVTKIEGDAATRNIAMQARDARSAQLQQDQAAPKAPGAGELPPGLQEKMQGEQVARAPGKDALEQPGLQAAMKAAQGQLQAEANQNSGPSAKQAQAPKAEGFPNGLSD